MMSSTEYNQLVLVPGDEFQVGVLNFTFDHAHIDFEIQHLGYDFRRVGDIELDICARIIDEVSCQVAGCQVVADGETGAHPQVTDVFVRAQCIFKALAVSQHLFGFLAQCVTHCIESQFVVDPIKQLDLIAVFKIQ